MEFATKKVEKLEDKEAEFELAELQIAQLQEELEFYYIKYNELNQTDNIKASHRKSSRDELLSNTNFKSCKIVGSYESEHYRDLHFQ